MVEKLLSKEIEAQHSVDLETRKAALRQDILTKALAFAERSPSVGNNATFAVEYLKQEGARPLNVADALLTKNHDNGMPVSPQSVFQISVKEGRVYAMVRGGDEFDVGSADQAMKYGINLGGVGGNTSHISLNIDRALSEKDPLVLYNTTGKKIVFSDINSDSQNNNSTTYLAQLQATQNIVTMDNDPAFEAQKASRLFHLSQRGQQEVHKEAATMARKAAETEAQLAKAKEVINALPTESQDAINAIKNASLAQFAYSDAGANGSLPSGRSNVNAPATTRTQAGQERGV